MSKQEQERFYLGECYPKIYFTPREMDCARHLLNGKTVKEIAKKIGISHRSVEFYLRNMRLKLGVGSKTELYYVLLNKTTLIRVTEET